MNRKTNAQGDLILSTSIVGVADAVSTLILVGSRWFLSHHLILARCCVNFCGVFLVLTWRPALFCQLCDCDKTHKNYETVASPKAGAVTPQKGDPGMLRQSVRKSLHCSGELLFEC